MKWYDPTTWFDKQAEERSSVGTPVMSYMDVYGVAGQKTVLYADVKGLTAYSAAARIISESVAGLPWNVFKRLPNGDRERVANHPVDRLLSDMASEYHPSHRLRVQIGMDLHYHGNCVVAIERDGGGRPIELHHLDWRNVGIQDVNDDTYYVYFDDGKPYSFAEGDVLHFRTSNIDTSTGCGISPIQQFSKTFGEIRDTRDMAAQHAESGGFLRGVIEMEGSLKDGMGPKAAASWRKNYLNKTNTGGVGVLEGGMKYKQLSSTLRDAQHVEIRGFQVAEVSRITGVPPHLLHSLDRATFNNIYELSKSFVTYTLAPFAKSLEAEVRAKLFTQRERTIYFTEHNFNGLLQANPEERANMYRELSHLGALSPNMVLRMENMNSYEGGDVRMVPANMIPVDQIADFWKAKSADNTTPQTTPSE